MASDKAVNKADERKKIDSKITASNTYLHAKLCTKKNAKLCTKKNYVS